MLTISAPGSKQYKLIEISGDLIRVAVIVTGLVIGARIVTELQSSGCQLSEWILPAKSTTVVKPVFAEFVKPDGIENGWAYLFSKQHQDGSWKSEYYGNLKQGAATTSLVLYALSHADAGTVKKHKNAIDRAIRFQRKGIAKYGFVANEQGPDYSNYATALLLLANQRFKERFQQDLLTAAEESKLTSFLVHSQLDETHGLDKTDDDYGGWDLSGWVQEPRESPGTNISISSFVLLALAKTENESVKKARSKAEIWLRKVQNVDHGFHFHPKKDHSGNKAGWSKQDPKPDDPVIPLSYGTATVDGYRAQRALDVSDRKRKQTANWLEEKTDEKIGFSFVPGFELPEENVEVSWGQGLWFYYLMSLSLEKQAFSKSFSGRMYREIPALLNARQKKDGRWENPSSRMREDDPLIATSFALITLSNLKP